MAWTVVYLCGGIVTWFLCIVAGAIEGKEKEAIGPAFAAALLWPFAWLYCWGVSYGKYYAYKKQEKAK